MTSGLRWARRGRVLAMARRTTLAVILLGATTGANRSEAQKPSVAFRGVIKSINAGVATIVTKMVSVTIESNDGSGRGMVLSVREGEAQLFGYGDEVEVGVILTGRKAQ